jgi:hypothetical protein
MTLKRLALGAGLTLALSILSACGGGGGGQPGTYNPPPVDTGDILRYPYETVYGDACRSSSEVTPGCTFSRATGLRVTVSADPMYNSQGYGSDDLWYVEFDSSGRGVVKDDLGNFKKYADASEFAGYIPGTYGSGTKIGVGTTGAFWESVAGNTYWFGKNGVLYSAKVGASNYGQAINNKKAKQISDANAKKIKSASNQALIKAGALKLQELGLSASKATAVASAMNSMAVMNSERGTITDADFNRTFKTLSGGVAYSDALAAVNAFVQGNKAPARDLTNRSAAALGLTAEEGEAYMKGLFAPHAKKLGLDLEQISLKD